MFRARLLDRRALDAETAHFEESGRVCGTQPVFCFSDPERDEIGTAAQRRQDDAVAYKESKNPLYLPGEVAGFNPLGNHFMGEVGEVVVSRWLAEIEAVEHDRPPSLLVEMEQGLADITTRVHGVKLDVKSSTSSGSYRVPIDQKGFVKGDAVVWCRMRRDQPFVYESDFNRVVPRGATILAWSRIDEAWAATPKDGYFHVAPPARCLATLVAWLRTGVPPP